ncbi:aminoglycoside phosphotransferase family protein [Nocardiopsis sp. CT-R113]|uniref:Aminoglycoside phosphotransferase family protein n=1 Tax=Nocardiopsis codii TaxID=3065942 RepID=A0ABU7K6C5_9ACTN|nr:aminoglycoside phosphotransferase family protein [Nocardiopsis sp. CT-R113]MEE2037582.1 aminoglycoside phosphotransferase family protein [Nocardiopsis sp. CT-R113]
MKHPPLGLTAELVRALLHEQHPDLADRPLHSGRQGAGNQMWRLGDDLAVRLPWTPQSAEALVHGELAWLGALAPRLPLPVPVPMRLGMPSARFQRPWIVTTWVPGTPADRAPVTDGARAAEDLAAFLTALHRPAPENAPVHRRSDDPLADCAELLTGQFASATAQGLIENPEAVRAVWEDAIAAPRWQGPPLWVHGDLHPANVLTREGAFCGVIDFGDLSAGDPACDLAAAWIMLPDGALDLFHQVYGPTADPATLRRARGWAVLCALGGLLAGAAGARERPGGHDTWGPPARASLRRLVQG